MFEGVIALDALVALLVASTLVVVLSRPLGVRTPWRSAWSLLLVLFLVVWAIGSWMVPVGPMVHGVSVVPFLAAGLMALLLVAALVAPPANSGEEPREVRAHTVAALGFSVFVWLLIIALSTAIALRYATG